MANYKLKQTIDALESRGVTIDDIIDIVITLQKEYNKELTYERAKDSLLKVLSKREVGFTIMTGIEFDKLAEQRKYIDKNLEAAILSDEALYGLDEVLAYSICNLFGSIALTNFGFVDKKKIGIIATLNNDNTRCNTFLDDIVGALAASAASLVAHYYGGKRGV